MSTTSGSGVERLQKAVTDRGIPREYVKVFPVDTNTADGHPVFRHNLPLDIPPEGLDPRTPQCWKAHPLELARMFKALWIGNFFYNGEILAEEMIFNPSTPDTPEFPIFCLCFDPMTPKAIKMQHVAAAKGHHDAKVIVSG